MLLEFQLYMYQLFAQVWCARKASSIWFSNVDEHGWQAARRAQSIWCQCQIVARGRGFAAWAVHIELPLPHVARSELIIVRDRFGAAECRGVGTGNRRGYCA